MLEISHLEVFYGPLQALFGVSLKVDKGEVVALVGANGAGKSTVLRTISSVIASAAGDIRFEGLSLSRVPSHRIVELGIVHVPEGRRLFPLLTVRENLILGAYIKSARKQRDETLARVYDMFPRLLERQHQLAGTLSGGEQQMVAIGRGLMAQPRLLMLDEPSLGLAPLLVTEIFKTIRRLQSEGITILLVEQNVQLALECASRGYVLENGRNALEGPASELLTSPEVREAYLGL